MRMALSPAAFIVLATVVFGGALPAAADENSTVEILGKDLVGTEVFIKGHKAGVITERIGELGHFTANVLPGKALVEIRKGGKTVWRKEIQVKKGSDYCLEATPAGVVGDDSSYAGEIYWRYDLSEALGVAAQENKPVMVSFYTSWCGWCRKQDSEIFPDPEVRSRASKFIAVKLDADQYKYEAERYKVRTFPTVVFLNSSGAEVNRVIGYQPKEDFCRIMDRVSPEEVNSGTAGQNAGNGTAGAPVAASTGTATAAVTGAELKNKLGGAKNKFFSILNRWAK